MTRYYFHLCENGNLDLDEIGILLPDASAAHREGVKGAQSMASEERRCHRALRGQSLVIVDEHGAQIATVPFQMADGRVTLH
jgi:hypothetical protein